MNKVLAGTDIGGTKIAAALETPSGESVARDVCRAAAQMPDENEVKIVSVGNQARKAYSNSYRMTYAA
ncbi:MAG TPA: hypothetical protein VGB68_07100 [Pyrinomonadaceae bacterium]|jgi:predicted NBD/HSP70 family sugar kinase